MQNIKSNINIIPASKTDRDARSKSTRVKDNIASTSNYIYIKINLFL